MSTFFIPGLYENPLTPEGRARTIAAFYLAQGNPSVLGSGEMRRDILRALMSPNAINYWLNQKEWLEVVRTVGRIQILRLTDDGLRTCTNNAAGGSDTPTTPELIESRKPLMLEGGYGHTERTFPELKLRPNMVFKPIRNGVSSIPVGNNLRPSYDHRSLRQTAVSGIFRSILHF